MEEVTSKPDFGGSGHSLGRHRGSERHRESKARKQRTWDMFGECYIVLFRKLIG